MVQSDMLKCVLVDDRQYCTLSTNYNSNLTNTT